MGHRISGSIVTLFVAAALTVSGCSSAPPPKTPPSANQTPPANPAPTPAPNLTAPVPPASFNFSGNSSNLTFPAPLTARITIVGEDVEEWGPGVAAISVGGVVTWVNNGVDTHSVISGEGLFSAYLLPGDTFSYTFNSSGTFTYNDVPPATIGTIIVQ